MNYKWITFAVGEGATKALLRMFHKFFGTVAGSFSVVLPIIVLTSAAQSVGGFLLALVRREPLFPGWKTLLLLVLFGISAAAMSVIVVFIFIFQDADTAIVTFFIAASIISDALAGFIFFKEKLRFRHFVGITIFFVSGYFILNFPSLSEIRFVAPWVILSLLLAFLLTVNEILMSASSKMGGTLQSVGPFVKNGWIGLSTFTVTILAVYFMGGLKLFSVLPYFILLLAPISGLATLIMISFKSLSYDAGATVVLKKLVMMGTYLSLVVIGGVMLYGEVLTLGKVLGIIGFVISFLCIKEGVLLQLKAFFKLKNTTY